MQISRLFEMVYLLQSRKRITAKELAARFEVSVRTILRDVQTLSEAGVPVYSMQGKGGGICILDSFVLNKTVLSAAEQDEILLALQSIATTEHMDAGATLRRLQALFAREEPDWVEVDFARWGNGGGDKARFALLRRAVMERQAISLRYSASNGQTTTRAVWPLKLVYKSKAWYLQAFCLTRQDYRTFKLGRMQDVTVLGEHFDPAQLTAPPIETMDPAVPLTQIVLRFSAQAAFRAYDEFDASLVEKQPDGSIIVTVSLPLDGWLYSYLLSFGAQAEVLSPVSVRKQMRQLLENILKNYTEHDTYMSSYLC